MTRPRFLLACLLALPLFTGCATARKKEADLAQDAARLKDYGVKIRKAFDLGKGLADADPQFVDRLEDQVLSETLRTWFSPMAGARRLLSFKDQRPDDPLLGVFLERDSKGRYFAVEDDPDFQAGLFFNSYEKALFQPFFRQVLLEYLKKGPMDDAAFLPLAKTLRMGAAFTPRYAGFYPNQIQPEVGQAAEKFIKENKGPAVDRLKFLLLFDERNAAWSGKRSRIDGQFKELALATQDELLKMEIKEALDTPFPAPEKSFWLSLALPGLGQVSNGDLQGGILLGGLTTAAWIWLVGKLSAAQTAPTDQARQVAQGDAVWAGSLVGLAHLFTAYNAGEQVRFFNIVMEWDLLSRPRLKP